MKVFVTGHRGYIGAHLVDLLKQHGHSVTGCDLGLFDGCEWEPLSRGLPQHNCYVNVLRESMSVDDLDPCGIYFGTTGGQVYASSDEGDTWDAIVRDLPRVMSVEVQSLP